MTSKERVKRAVHFERPDVMPILYFNVHTQRSDLLLTGAGNSSSFVPKVTGESEWGFVWKSVDKTMGQPENPPITDYSLLDTYVRPDGNDLTRYKDMELEIKNNPDKYVLAGVGISGFNRASYIRGFEGFLEDLYLDVDNAIRIIDMVIDYECELIENYARLGADCVSFGDDWGTQRSLIISPTLFREIFKPRYKKQFDLAHSLGMDVYFHSCGQVNDIIPDLIEIGVDVFNLNQPDIFGIEYLAKEYGGKVCFCCPVDHQTVAITGERADIFEYVDRLNGKLGAFNGGFIGYIEEYESIGLTPQNLNNIIEAFEGQRK